MAIVKQPDPVVPIRAGSPEGEASADSLSALVRQHQGMVWRYLRLLGADPHEADDLMQDTFVRVAEGLQRGEHLHAPAAFLRSVARNLLIGARRRRPLHASTFEWIDAVDRVMRDQPAALEDSRIEALRSCVERLQGRMRQAVEWHHKDGMSCQEAARRLGLGQQGIKSLLRRARQALRHCVEEHVAKQKREEIEHHDE
ncbi:MAG: sigma-70 family RNA polymerase sigma factor [Planctomycetota bacterium]